MRKVFWWSLAGGMMLTGGVFTVGYYAAQNPQSLTGRVIITAGQTVIARNPMTGFASPLVSVERRNQVEAAPVAGGEEQSEPQVEVVAGAIVIPEDEAVVHPEPAFDHLIQVVRAGEAEEADTSLPAMPPCEDDSDEVVCETLHMPAVEADAEEQEDTTGQVSGTVEKLLRMFESASRKSMEGVIDPGVPADSTLECREDPHRHLHHPGCPHTGRCPVPSAPESSKRTLPPTPVDKPESADKGDNGGSRHSSALRAIRRFTTRGEEDCALKHAEVDTMEFRASDGKLYDYGPNRRQ